MSVLANLQGLIGLALILLLAWGLSEDRAARPGWRWIGAALLAQLAIALVVTRVPFVWDLVGYANRAVAAVERATLVGSSYMFGYTGGAPIPFLLKPGVEHVVRNTGPGKLYCLTLMAPNEGFAELIRGGQAVALDEEDLAVLRGMH